MNLRRLKVETTRENLISRFIDLLAPLAKGQRGLVVGPPQTGHKLILETIANSITVNHPEVVVMLLLLDQHGDEATAVRRSLKAEVFFSTRQEPQIQHIHLAETVIAKARRLVEKKKNVLLLMDSMTRLAQAYGEVLPLPNETEPGAMNPHARREIRQFGGATCNLEAGGSLTTVTTAEVENRTPANKVLLEELVSAADMQLVLDNKVLEQGIFPAVNIHRSGNRSQEMFVPPEDVGRTFVLRKVLQPLSPAEAAKLLGGKLLRTRSNSEFLSNMSAL